MCRCFYTSEFLLIVMIIYIGVKSIEIKEQVRGIVMMLEGEDPIAICSFVRKKDRTAEIIQYGPL